MSARADAGGARRQVTAGRTAAVMALALALTCVIAAGCAPERDPAAWLEESGRAVGEYAAGEGYLHFLQEMESVVGTTQGEFGQVLRVEGDIIFPGREAYGYAESLSSSLSPGQEQGNSFSYLTLDGGATAYVMGERLSAELGVSGWIRYTPASGQDRFFDYPRLLASIVSMGQGPEWLGHEEEDGVRCARVRYAASAEEMLDLRVQQDPSFAGQYQGLQAGGLGGLTVEVWIGEEDKLPRRVFMEQTVSTPEGVSGATRVVFTFSAYGEEPPLTIEAPAFFHEAV